MKVFISFIAGLFIVLAGLQEAVAQDRFEKIKVTYIELRFDEAAFETMKRNAGEKGISPADLGSWMDRSGNVMLKIEGVEGELVPPHTLSVFAIDSRGNITGRESGQAQLTERPALLGQATRNMMPGLTDGLMAFDAFMAVDMFIPQTDYISSPLEAERMMRDSAMRAMRSSGTENAIVMMIIPEGRSFDYRVSPGMVIFTGNGI